MAPGHGEGEEDKEKKKDGVTTKCGMGGRGFLKQTKGALFCVESVIGRRGGSVGKESAHREDGVGGVGIHEHEPEAVGPHLQLGAGSVWRRVRSVNPSLGVREMEYGECQRPIGSVGLGHRHGRKTSC